MIKTRGIVVTEIRPTARGWRGRTADGRPLCVRVGNNYVTIFMGTPRGDFWSAVEGEPLLRAYFGGGAFTYKELRRLTEGLLELPEREIE